MRKREALLPTGVPRGVWAILLDLYIHQDQGPIAVTSACIASVQEIWGGDMEQRLAVASSLGMTGRMAERVAAGRDPEMGRAVLKLLRSARQPAMSEEGQLLPRAAQRPGTRSHRPGRLRTSERDYGAA